MPEQRDKHVYVEGNVFKTQVIIFALCPNFA